MYKTLLYKKNEIHVSYNIANNQNYAAANSHFYGVFLATHSYVARF